jgi:hypothetical protein
VNLPRILPPLGISVERGQAFLLTEFFPNGTLADAAEKWQKKRPPAGFGPTQLTKCIFGIAFTMAAFILGAESTEL